MPIDYREVERTLERGEFPSAKAVSEKFQWIANRLHCTTHGIHGYCHYTRKTEGENKDLDYIEDCMIQIIDAATFILKTTRHLKKLRSGINDPW